MALGLSTGGFTMMDDEDPPPSGGDPCSTTSLTQPFYVTSITNGTNGTTIIWQSCPMFRYIVLSANVLSTNTAWAAQGFTSYIWGQPGASATSWTDLSTTNTSVVTQRFYKVEKILGNQIAVGGFHSLVILTNGMLWVWGDDSTSQLGDGRTDDEAAPEPLTDSLCGPAQLSNAVALAGGSDYSVAVDASGVVWSWGEGTLSGQLGNGGNTNVLTPTPISGISNVIAVAAGFDHTLALRADGTIWAWGDNGNGELGTGGPLTFTNRPALVTGLTQMVAIAAGDLFSLALDATGRIWGWGDNEDGELGTNAAVGEGHNTNLPVPVSGISNVIAIAAGYNHSVALTTNKTVWTWGDNSYGELGRSGSGPMPGQVNLTNVVAITAGFAFTLAVTSNGQVYGFGNNSDGQVSSDTSGNPTTSPALLPGISNAVLVSTQPMSTHCLALTVNQGTNQYYGWGNNFGGAVGDGGGEDDQYTPAQLHFDDVCTTCVQLGTSGAFTAQYTGTLKLYFNDAITAYDNNSGSYTAMVNGTNVTVLAANGEGVAVGIVTNGGVYGFSASGFCRWDPTLTNVDANGVIQNGTSKVDCAVIGGVAVCPNSQCFSLVGRIQ